MNYEFRRVFLQFIYLEDPEMSLDMQETYGERLLWIKGREQKAIGPLPVKEEKRREGGEKEG